MRPSSKRCSGGCAAALLCFACAAPGARPTVGVSATDEPERRAPGVSEVRPLILPAAARTGTTDEQLLLLRAPPATELARGAVRTFLRATVSEALDRIEPLLAEQAFVDVSGGRQQARAFWQLRFAQLDYTELRGQLLFRETDLQTFRAEDLARLPPNRRLALELGADEVAVRVPIRLSWAGRTRLFGDELLFRLQPRGAGFEITQITEDFRLP